MECIRWGILGAGSIAHRFAAALERVEGDDAESDDAATRQVTKFGAIRATSQGKDSDEASPEADASDAAAMA